MARIKYPPPPNAVKHHRPHDPQYLRALVTRSGLSQRAVARTLGYDERRLRQYLNPNDKRATARPPVPYSLQYSLELVVWHVEQGLGITAPTKADATAT